MTRRLIALLSAFVLVLAACGGSDDGGEDGTAPTTTSAAAADTSAEGAAETTTTQAAEQQASSSGGAGRGTATVKLDNGEEYEFSVLCALEPQIAAGSEILFTAVSYDDPVNLDITQFGEDDFNGMGSVGLYDSTTYDTLWELNAIFVDDIRLALEGSTIMGSGTFYPGEAKEGEEPVYGEVVANC